MNKEQQLPRLPKVNDRVYYYAFGTPGGEFPAGIACAATITEVDRPNDPCSSVGLAILNPTGLFFNRGIKYGHQVPGCWGWMEDEETTRPVKVTATTTGGISIVGGSYVGNISHIDNRR